MTAICGWIGASIWGSIPEHVRSSLDTLAPYGRGHPKILIKGDVAFGIDLDPRLPEDEHDCQPLQFGPNFLVADLRIDNRGDIAGALNVPLAELPTIADSTLLAQAWAHWGAKSLTHVVGDYAVAVHSTAEQTTWLARSIGGNRPLFYAQSDGILAFASMPSGILSEPLFRRGFCLERVVAGLVEQLCDDDRSYFEGIYRVLPGQIVSFGPKGIAKEDVWRPRYEDLQLRSLDSLVEAYRSVLDTAVSSRLRRSTGCVGSQLSAGYDSSAVTTTAARLIDHKSSLLALTAAPRRGYDGPSYAGRLADESQFASLTARSCGIEHLIVRSVGKVPDLWRRQVALYQDPFRNVLNSAWDVSLRDKAAERGASVMLTGELGNLTLNAGGLDSLSDFLRQGQFLAWFRQVMAARSNHSWRSIAGGSFRPWLPPTLFRFARLRTQIPATKTYFLRRAWMDRMSVFALPTSTGRRISNERRFNAIQQFDSGTVRTGALAETGTDIRDPLIDRRIIEFSVSLPPDQLFHDGTPSPLAKAALADRVPEEILKKRIRGYQAADWHLWFTAKEARSITEEISQSPTARELIDFERLLAAIDSWPSGSGLETSAVIQRYTGTLPMTLVAGLFFRHFEKNGHV